MKSIVDFSTSNRVIFGVGSISKLTALLENFGRNALFLQKRNLKASKIIHNYFSDNKIEYQDIEVSGEPNVEKINQITQLAREYGCDFVVGLGGGSVLDTGKAVSALLSNPGDLLDYLEVVGGGQPLNTAALPYIAIPTTSGTGSEVTKNAVISVPEKKVKVSMRHNYLLPEIALVDPELTYELPDNVTAFSGMDALTQVIEPYLSNGRNLMVDLFCRDAIQKAGQNLKRAYQNGSDVEARMNMSWVSLMGGLSLANAKLGAVHGLAGPMGGMFDLPHGMICAALLHSAMEVNYQVIKSNESDNPVLQRFTEIARWLTGREEAGAEEGIYWIKKLTLDLKIPKLSEIGVTKDNFPEIIEKSKNSSSMKGNPTILSPENIAQILEKSY